MQMKANCSSSRLSWWMRPGYAILNQNWNPNRMCGQVMRNDIHRKFSAVEQSEADGHLSVQLSGCYRNRTRSRRVPQWMPRCKKTFAEHLVAKNPQNPNRHARERGHHSSQQFPGSCHVYYHRPSRKIRQGNTHPAYNSDLSPSDYDLNPKLKESMCGVCFWYIEELMARIIQEICRVTEKVFGWNSEVADGLGDVCCVTGGLYWRVLMSFCLPNKFLILVLRVDHYF